jgi:hypothetical protein
MDGWLVWLGGWVAGRSPTARELFESVLVSICIRVQTGTHTMHGRTMKGTRAAMGCIMLSHESQRLMKPVL